MSTFKQIQDDVLDLCQELQAQTDFTLKRVKRLINRGQIDFARKTKCIESDVSITTVANQAEYSYSDASDLQYFITIDHVRYIQSASDVGDVLKPYPGGWSALPKTMIYGTPTKYWHRKIFNRQGLKIGTWPIAGTSSLTLKVYGSILPTAEMSADGDYPQIADQYHDALVDYAVWRSFELYSHSNGAWANKAFAHKTLYENLVNELAMDSASVDTEPAVIQNAYGDY